MDKYWKADQQDGSVGRGTRSSLGILLLSLEHTQRRKRTEPTQLLSDLHIPARARARPDTHIFHVPTVIIS